MITVIETRPFIHAAKNVLSGEEVKQMITMIALNPECGDLLQGTGGLRKVRVGAKGKGKSGGARVIYYYYKESMPVFLFTVFAKGVKDNLTKAERNALAQAVKKEIDSYGKK